MWNDERFTVVQRGDENLYKHMIDLLEKGEVDTSRFNEISGKTLYELFEELLNREVTLIYDSVSKRVIRCAVTATVCIRLPSKYLNLLEVKREFLFTGKVEERIKKWSISETRKTGEEITAAAVRGLWEELDLRVQPQQLKIDLAREGHEFKIYQSSAYVGLWSYAMLQPFTLDLHESPWPIGDMVVQDGTTLKHLKWFTY